MTTFQTSIYVYASIEDIEAYARYADSWSSWFPGVKVVEVGDDYPEVGSNAYVTFSAAGVDFDLTLTVAEYVFGDIVTYNFDGMAHGTTSFYLSEEADTYGVTAYVEYTLAGGVLGQVADKLVVEKRVAENFEQALFNLKTALEGG